MATGVEHSSPDTSSEHVSATACSAFCYDGRKDVGVLPIVMTERKLRQIQRQIVLADLVIGAHYSALEQAPEAIQVRRMDVPTHIFALRMVNRLMRKLPFQPRIARVFIGGNQRHILTHGLPDKVAKGESISILNDLTDHIAFTGNGSNHTDFPAADSRGMGPLALMPVLIPSADVRFVNFHFTHELAESAILHGCSDAMAHIPGRAVVTAPDLAVNLQGTDPLLALGHQVDDLEPGTKRVVGILEYGARNDREAVAVPSTATRVLADPVKRASFQRIDFRALTARALRIIWPALIVQKLLARFFGREASHQLRQGHRGFHRVPSLC